MKHFGGNVILNGDCLIELATLPAQHVQTCVTSPPYWGLRDYGVDGQLGLEKTPDEYVANMVRVFREVRRVLKDDGTLWLNLGDSYASNTKGSGGKTEKQSTNKGSFHSDITSKFDLKSCGIKPKDLVGIPWRVAFALQADGWYLRQDIIWHKPNPMPESVRDRCTKAHEYIFLLAKSAKYQFDSNAIKEPAVSAKGSGNKERKQRPNADTLNRGNQAGSIPWNPKRLSRPASEKEAEAYLGRAPTNLGRCGDNENGLRNRRSVWTVTTKPFKGAHFATFPPDLIEPCILAGSAFGDYVLDPFAGSGTTGMVARKHGRKFIGVELNSEYVQLAEKRIGGCK